MRHILVSLFLVLGIACGASAQSLTPLVGEGGHGQLKGSFTISNTEVIAMVTAVDVRSVDLHPDGTVAYRPLDSAVTVHLAETSAKIGPRQSHTFFYSVDCRSFTSCVVAFLPGSVFGRTTNGMQVRVVLPHVLYICQQGANGCRKHIREAAGIAQ